MQAHGVAMYTESDTVIYLSLVMLPEMSVASVVADKLISTLAAYTLVTVSLENGLLHLFKLGGFDVFLVKLFLFL